MNSLFIKKGDTVYVNAGNDRGKTGRVVRVLVKKNRAVVEGINMVSKSVKPSAKHPQGTRKERRYVILKSQERRLSNEFNKS